MGLFSQYTRALFRMARLRKWWIIVPALIIVVFSLHVRFNSSRGPGGTTAGFQPDEHGNDKLEITEPNVKLYKDFSEKKLPKNHEESSNGSSLAAKCRLPVLDPFHSSVKNLIVDLGKLDCGTTLSRFENNTLYVEAPDAVSVSYRIINRPKSNDFGASLSAPFAITNIKNADMKGELNQVMSPGISGCLMHLESKKCLHPYGGDSIPKNGTSLVFHTDCCFHRIQFKMKTDGRIQHVPSELCLHVDDKAVTLQSSCSTKFQVNNNGSLQITASGLCIQSESLDKIPENDGKVVVDRACTQTFQVVIPAKGKPFRGSAHVNTDFVRVDIKRSGKPDITEVHMQTAPKPEVLKRKVKKSGIPVNIALIMFDSTSAANFIRKMPKTNDYLKTRPTVFMKGNTIVGDGTTAQLCAMLTGVPEEEQPESRRSKPNAKVVDDWKWVFRDYQKHGYVTMYSEDSPGLGTFNYRLKGFKNPPTDHYGRYFWFEAQSHIKTTHCAGSDAVHRITFKYFLSLFRSYTERLKIAFLLFSELTHGNMNSIKFADADLLELLQTMDRDNYLDDTIVFIFGDHGLRFGAMRKTFQGKLEERLPHMSITFPTWFPKRYPQLYEAVQQNSKLLTTPFDIYGTIQHVLSYPLAPKGVTIGQSLFIPIDAQNRTCASTGVEDHWCPCMNFENVPIQDPVVIKIANFTVAFINNLLKNDSKVEPLCHKLSLKEVKTALREMPNDKVQKFKTSYRDHRCDSCGVSLGDKDENTLTHDTLYQIQFVTSPNDGFYEASVRVHGGNPTIKGSISRIDTYGHQPDCIKNTYVHLLKYCYCK